MDLRWWMTLCNLSYLSGLLSLGTDLMKMRPYSISVKCSSHCVMIHVNWMDWLIVRSDCFWRHWNYICHPLVDCWISSLVNITYATVLLSWIITSLTALIPIFYCLPTLWSAIWCTKKFLCRIQWHIKSLREIAFQVWCAVKCLSLIKCYLLVDVVLARYAFFLFEK